MNNDTTPAQEAEVILTPVSASPAPAATDEYKQQALIAWVAAPFYSPTLKKSDSEFVRAHAEASYYYGVSALAVLVGLIAFNFLLWNVVFNLIAGNNPFNAYTNYGTFNMIGNIVSLAAWAYILAPRAYGAFKSQSMEVWAMPKVKELVSKYIKF